MNGTFSAIILLIFISNIGFAQDFTCGVLAVKAAREKMDIGQKLARLVAEREIERAKTVKDEAKIARLTEEIRSLSELAMRITQETYDKQGEAIAQDRDDVFLEEDRRNLEDFLNRVRKSTLDGEIVKIVDPGCGRARDTEWFNQQSGVYAIGYDYSQPMTRIASERSDDTSGKVISADMKGLPFPDEAVHGIRNHAALLHLPMTGEGEGADLAVTEEFRVLKPGGVYFIAVKQGEGFSSDRPEDQAEGWDDRYFQLYEEEDLRALLARNGFVDIEIKTITKSDRPELKWLWAYARKPASPTDNAKVEVVHRPPGPGNRAP